MYILLCLTYFAQYLRFIDDVAHISGLFLFSVSRIPLQECFTGVTHLDWIFLAQA